MLKVFQGVTWTTIKWSMTTISNQLFTTGYTYTSFKGQYFPVNIHASNYMKVHLQNGIFCKLFMQLLEQLLQRWIAMKMPADYCIVLKRAYHQYTRTSAIPPHKFANFNFNSHRLIISRWPRARLVLLIAFPIEGLKQWRNQTIWTAIQLIIQAKIFTHNEIKNHLDSFVNTLWTTPLFVFLQLNFINQ